MTADLAELERAALQKRDEKTALVFADALQEASDPRGEVIALEHALWKRPPSLQRHAQIEARLLELARAEGPRLYGRPGGFPLQQEWGTRAHYDLNDGWTLTEPKRELTAIRSFLSRFTNADLSGGIFAAHEFRLLHPDTRLPFPFQAGVHCGLSDDFASSLHLDAESSRAALLLRVPIECFVEVFELREEMFAALDRPWLSEQRFERGFAGFAVGGKLRER